MKEIVLKNQIYRGANNKEALYDFYLPENQPENIIIFNHGFMGFKDWGAWHLVAKYFLSQGYAFLLFNHTHNGTSLKNPTEFVDLESFAENRYSYELTDLLSISAKIRDQFPNAKYFAIGHSRGGGNVLLAEKLGGFQKIASWAGISSIAERFPKNETLEQWKKIGYRLQHNSRTQQDLKISYAQYLDFQENKAVLQIEEACRNSKTPTLVIHGSQDEAVSITEGQKIAEWTKTNLITISGANHTFGAVHPYSQQKLPVELEEVCHHTFHFFHK